MKKIISLTLCFVLAALCAVPAMAQENDLPPTGLIWDTWESFLANMNETTLYALATQRSGDVDGDGRITASDARLCLRYSAKLEELTASQQTAADTDNNLTVNSADARRILRASAKLDELAATVIETTSDWGCVIGALETAGSGNYSWHYSVDNDGLTVNEYSIVDSELLGAPAKQYFAFSPEAEGEYTVTLTLVDAAQTDVLAEFDVVIIVSD